MTQPIADNKPLSRFEFVQDGHTAFADYRRENGTLVILHVEAPMELRGKGAAGALMQGIMEQARQENVKVQPVCGYAATWIARHKEFADLLAG